MEGRLNVAFEDIQDLAKPILRHRLILNFDSISENLRAEDIIDKVIEELKVV